MSVIHQNPSPFAGKTVQLKTIFPARFKVNGRDAWCSLRSYRTGPNWTEDGSISIEFDDLCYTSMFIDTFLFGLDIGVIRSISTKIT